MWRGKLVMMSAVVRGLLFVVSSLFGSLTIVFQRTSVASEVASTSFRFPETKSAHLKFSPLSDNNLRRLICLHAMSLFI
jgi:hypothetical protein